MTLDREWLLAVARAEREALGRTVQYTAPEAWEADSPCEGWRNKDVLAHLAAAEVAAAAIVAGEEATEVEEYRKTLEGRPFRGTEWNDWTVARRRDVPTLQLATEWGRAADLLLARAGKATDEEWRDRMVAWTAGEIRFGYLIQARVAEWWAHGEDIREGSLLPPRGEHPPIYVLNDLAIRMIPYALSQEGHSFPGRSVQIELEGVGEGRWHQGLEAGKTPAEGKRPDAYIEGRGYEFASVAAKRADPDTALYEGVIQTGGDLEIAEAILRSLRSFA
ncbi:MAG TPA: maleylpyruvate isomerase family mycothiol-dependent enzyme [Actinomycetota bacterium]|nr:maleylpyruvate isomerase family mycothiol-dependent enzyme [Actinomycetota bacterium]